MKNRKIKQLKNDELKETKLEEEEEGGENKQTKTEEEENKDYMEAKRKKEFVMSQSSINLIRLMVLSSVVFGVAIYFVFPYNHKDSIPAFGLDMRMKWFTSLNSSITYINHGEKKNYLFQKKLKKKKKN